MNTIYTEASILDRFIAQRTTVNIWLNGGIKLTGIPRFQDSTVLVLEPLDTTSPEACLIIYKRACASVGRVSSQEWARHDRAKRKSRAHSEGTIEAVNT
jgi:sRNA-binding regulator protein Hfq